MKKVLYLLNFVVGLMFFSLYTWLIFNSTNLIVNSILIFFASIIVAFFKALTFNEEAKKVNFNIKEFVRLFFTEELIKNAMLIAFTLWYNKLISGLGCFLLILSSFIVFVLLIGLYYWMLKSKRIKELTK